MLLGEDGNSYQAMNEKKSWLECHSAEKVKNREDKRTISNSNLGKAPTMQ